MTHTERGRELRQPTHLFSALLNDPNHEPEGRYNLPTMSIGGVGDWKVSCSYKSDMTLGERIRWARKRAKLRQHQVAEPFGIDRANVAQWEAGTSNPDPDRMPALADLFGVPLMWLWKNEGPLPPDLPSKPVARPEIIVPQPQIVSREHLTDTKNFPVYAAAQGGQGHLIMTNDVVEYIGWPDILQGVPRAYGMLVRGDSMVPAFRPNEIALVHPKVYPAIDTDVILYDHPPFGGSGNVEAIIKRLIGFTDKRWRLEQYKPAKQFEEDRIDWPECHRVVGKYSPRL